MPLRQNNPRTLGGLNQLLDNPEKVEIADTPPTPNTLKLALEFENNLNNLVDNGITFSQASGTPITYATGKVGQAMSAVTNCVFQSSASSELSFDHAGGDVISFSTWFNTSNNLNTDYTYFFFLVSNAPHIGCDSDNSGRIRVLIRNTNNTNYTLYQSNTGQGETGWHLVSATIKKEPDPSKNWTIKLWWDTTLKIDLSTTLSDYNSTNGNSFLEFGSVQVSALYDQYCLWHGRELTQTDVESLYNSNEGRNYDWVAANLS